MTKIRVSQIAKEMGIKVLEAIAQLKALGVEARSGSSTVERDLLPRLRGLQGARSAPTAAPAPAKRVTSGGRTTTARGTAAKPARSAKAKTTPARKKTTVASQATTAPQARKAAGAVSRPSPGTVAQPSQAKTRSAATKARPAVSAPAGARRPGAPARPAPPRTVSAPAAAQRTARPATPARPAAATPPQQPLRRPVVPAGKTALIGARPGAAVPPPAGGAGLPAGGLRPAAPTGARPGLVPPRPQRPLIGPGGTPSVLRPGVRQPVPPAAARRSPSVSTTVRPPAGAQPTPGPVVSRPRPAALRTRPAAPAGVPRPAAPPPPPLPEVFQEIAITEGVTVKELSEKMNRKAKDIITRLLGKGILATMNQPLDTQRSIELCREFGFEAKVVSFEEEAAIEHAEELKPADLKTRDPVVTIMGHVDHGKTSLLDTIRESNIVASEAGGITQHIGAYHIRRKNRGITFIDTPGHEAFTLMRARGARVTDIVVLVVAADDGVMPQTVEAIDHARAAGAPLVVAINKIDKPNANLDRVKKQLSDHGLLVEDWGGKVVCVPVSAKQKTGIDDLLEMVLLVADLADLKVSPTGHAAGTILESRLHKARGPMATVLVQRGTLQVGDPFIAGAVHGKVRALFDDAGHRIREAGPSTPVEVLGLEGVPRAGDLFQVLEAEWRVRQIGAFRQQKLRQEAMAKTSRLTLDQLHQQIKEGMVKELPLVVKADVQGSVEALTKTLQGLPSDRVKTRVIHAGSGAITETDVLLASASNAIIIGYNVRPERGAQELAEKEKVDTRLHSVIYDITREIKSAMMGLLEPESKEVYLGRAEVRKTFKVPKIGVIAGCMVADGRILRGADVRLLRDNVVVISTRVGSLKRLKDDVSEVRAGYECGIGLANFNDIKIGDVIEGYRIEKIAAKSL